jgi:hypothetical protein
MEAFTRKRSSARSRRLLLEPLEERYLLTTLLNPAGALTSPTVSAPPDVVTAPVAASPPVVTQPATGPGVSPSPYPADGSPTTAPQTYDGSPSTVGSPKTGTASRTGAISPSVDQRSAAPAASVRGHDRDHGKGDDYHGDEDDEDDEHEARLAEEASVARTAVGASAIRTDDAAEEAESRLVLPSAGPGGEQQEAAPPPSPASAAASEAVALERAQPAAARTETATLPDAPPGAFVRGPAAELQPAVAEAIEVPETRTAFGIPWSGAPAAGAVGVDLRLVEQGVHAFFARLTSLQGDAVSAGLTNGIAASWLTAVAAVALEIARARDKARRSSLGADGSAVLGCAETGERE